MAQIPLEWRLSVEGANEVKSKLSDINNQFQRGEISASDYAKELRSVNRDARAFTSTTSMQKNLFLAQHPAINLVSRSTSMLASTARSALTISNALNLVMLRQQGVSSQLMETQHELASAQRDYNMAIRDFGRDSPQAADALERINIATARLKEISNGEFFGGLTEVLVSFGAVALGINEAVKMFTKLKGIISGLSLGGLGAALTNPFVLIPALALAAGYSISEFFRQTVPEFKAWQDNTKAMLDNFFLVSIPTAIGQAGLFLTNFFLNDLPTWASIAFDNLSIMFTEGWNGLVKLTEGAINGILSGIESMANSFISIINRMISAYNSVARKLGLGTLSTISGISLPRVTLPTIAAANGFNGMVNQPTMFLAGESGSEHVSITPTGKSSSTSSSINVYVQGSILTEKELYRKIDENMKRELRSRNFRLLQ